MAVPGSPLPDPSITEFSRSIQALFIQRGMSLADPETAKVYRTSLDAMRMLLAGAAGTGIVDADQLLQLRAMVTAGEYAVDAV